MTNYTELIERLKEDFPETYALTDIPHPARQAANAIEALVAERDALRADYKRHTEALTHDCAALRAELDAIKAQEPVAVVDANDDGYWADILPDRSVKVGQQLYASPQPAPEKQEPVDEQAAFEEWLDKTRPSGDVESVQRQWEASGDYQELYASTHPTPDHTELLRQALVNCVFVLEAGDKFNVWPFVVKQERKKAIAAAKEALNVKG